ncbi:MAG: hypothetical protein JWN04_491 [Myxococcaceae bacterium]|nr:hypothetical protein [Myxococcaceae bacterium]
MFGALQTFAGEHLGELAAVLNVLPLTQPVQPWSEVAEPAVDTNVPAAQIFQAMQLTALMSVLNELAPQLKHPRSATSEPGAAGSTYFPAGQVIHAAQVAAFASALKVPAAQAAQTRSALVVPLAMTDFPGGHEVHGTHAVAGSPSLSQLPSAQGTAGAVPPAQNCPAVVQGLQTGSVLEVAGAVCTVPTPQTPGTLHMGALETVELVFAGQGAQERSLADVPEAVTN